MEAAAGAVAAVPSVRFCKRVGALCRGPRGPRGACRASWGPICYSGPGYTGLVAPSVKTKTGTRALGPGTFKIMLQVWGSSPLCPRRLYYELVQETQEGWHCAPRVVVLRGKGRWPKGPLHALALLLCRVRQEQVELISARHPEPYCIRI